MTLNRHDADPLPARRFYVLTSVIAIIGLLWSVPLSARSTPSVPTLSPEELEQGMTGYGKTVFRGHDIDTFAVEVKGVLDNALPDQDLILIDAKHPVLKKTQIMSGMSGSPIYINGKLIGALAYSWGFAKEPIAGVTPIGAIFEANRRSVPVTSNEKLEKVELTLTTSGLSGNYRGLLEEKLGEFGLAARAVQGGSAESSTENPEDSEAPFEPGSALGAQLMSGDVSMTAVGTVTHVEGDKIFAFGHPFLNSGQIDLPMTTAEVHLPMPSVQSSFKLSSPLERVGSVTEDRQASVVGRYNDSANMIPASITLRAKGRPFSDTYGVKVIRNQYLTPSLLNLAASNLASTQMNQLGMNRVESRIHISLQNGKNVRISKSNVASGSFDPWAFLPLSGLWQNPFRKFRVESVDIDMTMTPELKAARIEDAWLANNTLTVGEKATVYAKINPYRGKPFTRSATFEIPKSLSGDKARLHVVPGSMLKGLRPRPQTFDQLISFINSDGLKSEIGVLLQIPKLSFNASGHRLDHLPYSIAGSFGRVTETNADYEPVAMTRRIKTDWVLQGRKSLTLNIKN